MSGPLGGIFWTHTVHVRVRSAHDLQEKYKE